MPQTIIKLICCLCLVSAIIAQGQTSETLAESTNKFLATLNESELKLTNFAFGDTMRTKWTNLPVGLVPRQGIQYGLLSDQSRMAFHRVLTAILSSQGYLKLTSIMQLDDILNVLYQKAFDDGKIKEEQLKKLKDLKWAYDNYYIAIWGTPQQNNDWGLSFGGHHIALALTVSKGSISVTPLFIGTDPAEIKSSKYAGWRVLSKEEDYGFALINLLSDQQKTKAILSKDVPKDIITNPKSSQRIEGYYGISGKDLNKDQKELLLILANEYLHNFEHDIAHRLITQLEKTGMDKIYFAWIGSLQRDSPHYYIIHSPDFLIEYDNFQGNGNHIHAILREKGNDFGEDLLKTHYQSIEHKRN